VEEKIGSVIGHYLLSLKFTQAPGAMAPAPSDGHWYKLIS
jgi:hypothetical protein